MPATEATGDDEFFDEKDARSSFFELPILALDLDEPGLLKG